MHLVDPQDLAGLPKDLVDRAKAEAEARGKSEGWVITLDASMRGPFMRKSPKRSLRRQLHLASRALATAEPHDNGPVVARIAALRAERAQLLGYETHAHYVLAENMAKTPENARGLLQKIWGPASKKAGEENRELQSFIDEMHPGEGLKLEPWDRAFYSDKLRAQRFNFDSEALRPYFSLDAVRDVAFEVVGKLFGLTFNARPDVSTWHPDVSAYEVLDAAGAPLGTIYFDFHAREGKSSGAWMDSLRKQSMRNGERVAPVVVNVCNFPKATGKDPVTLSFGQAQTLFHELGHGIHGLLSQCEYASLSGTATARDFVELPSQILEQWLDEPEVLGRFRHHETGERIPEKLLETMRKARSFGSGAATSRYLAASFLDLDWHALESTTPQDHRDFESRSMRKLGLPASVEPTYGSTFFGHIFGGGYAAGYYTSSTATFADGRRNLMR
jgi:peptidyl-dipeptidase Dcp